MNTTTGAHDQAKGPSGGPPQASLSQPDAARSATSTAPTAWFDRWATQYDSERRLLISPFDAFYDAAAEAAAILPDGTRRTAGADGGPIRVLDLGAGTGLLTAVLATALPGAELTLVDEAPGMLEQAKDRLADIAGQLTLIEGDLLGDLPEGPFDVIASGLAIHHLDPPDQARVYLAARERLAPGGVFVNAEQLKAPAQWLEDHYLERELVHARAGGFTPEAEQQAWIRWSIDQHVTLEDQLAWLHAAGYDAIECVFKSWRFAVVAGWRSP